MFFRTSEGTILGDTASINNCNDIPGVKIHHMGYGEFYADTPHGRVDWCRGGPDFEGCSGRSHTMTGDGQALAWLLREQGFEREPRDFHVTFSGKTKGAIGDSSAFAVTVRAANHAEARLKVYETHEHLSGVKIVEVL